MLNTLKEVVVEISQQRLKSSAQWRDFFQKNAQLPTQSSNKDLKSKDTKLPMQVGNAESGTPAALRSNGNA